MVFEAARDGLLASRLAPGEGGSGSGTVSAASGLNWYSSLGKSVALVYKCMSEHVSICIQIYICIYIYIYIYIHIYLICIYIHTSYIHVCTGYKISTYHHCQLQYTYMYVYICMCIDIYTYTYM